MKRVGFILFGAVVATMLTAAVGFGVVRDGLSVHVNTAQAGEPAPSSPTATDDTGPVCIAVPIFADEGSKGGCKTGQVEIPNEAGSGGAIIYYLKWVLKLINGLVGGIIILVLVIAGVQYIGSGGDPTRVKAAKNRIMHAITALVLYMMMVAILNFLVPGGIL